jgi:hypothetical protein
MDSVCKEIQKCSIEYKKSKALLNIIKSNRKKPKKRKRNYSNLMNSIINNDSENSNSVQLEACIPKKVDKI